MTDLPTRSEELPCQTCGGQNPVWSAPNEIWNLIMGGPGATDDPGGILCPRCFIEQAASHIRTLEARIGELRTQLQRITEHREATSELHTSADECADTMAVIARKALENGK